MPNQRATSSRVGVLNSQFVYTAMGMCTAMEAREFHVELCSPNMVDPDFFSSHPGVAVVVLSEAGKRGASVAAYLERPDQAVIYEKWVTGPPRFWRPAFDELLNELRRLNVRVVRAGASSSQLKRWYEQNLGMSVWQELVRYERDIGNTPTHRSSGRGRAVVRPAALDRDRAALEKIWAEEPDHPPISALEDLARTHRSRFMVAEVDESVCGYCFSYLEGDIGCLKSVIVSAARRGQGIGRQLVADAVGWFDELRVPSFLNTEAGNPVTHSLYASFGYRKAGSFVVLERSL